MKLLNLSMFVLFLFTIAWSQEKPKEEDYFFICPVIAPQGAPEVYPEEYLYVGNYTFNIHLDGGVYSKKMLDHLSKYISEYGGCLKKGKIIFYKNKEKSDFPLNCSLISAFRKVEIMGDKMIVEKMGKNKHLQTIIVNLKDEKEEDYFRRMLYPVEPSDENNQTGWPEPVVQDEH